MAFSVDYDDLAAACGSADLVASLEVQPVEGLACLAAAAHEVRREKARVGGEGEREKEQGLSGCVTARLAASFWSS